MAVLALHGQLAPVAWAFAQANPGAAPGLRPDRGGSPARLPLADGRCAAGERPALRSHRPPARRSAARGRPSRRAERSTTACRRLAGTRPSAAPGPGIVGSSSRLGHGGMLALDSAHVALALGCPTLLVARMSSADPRERHRGISHHTLTVLDLLLEPVTRGAARRDALAGRGGPAGRASGSVFGGSAPARPAPAVEVERPARIARHDWRRAEVDLPAYAASGLPSETMGRGLAEDPLFFAAALAGGTRAGRAARGGPLERERRGARMSSIRDFEWLGGETVYSGRIVDVTNRALPPCRRGRGLSRGRPPPRRRGDPGLRRGDRSGWSASRARRSTSPTCWRFRQAGWTRRARSRWRRPSASWPRRSAVGRATGSRSSPTTPARDSPTSRSTCSPRRTSTRRAPTAASRSGSNSCRGRSSACGEAIAECRDAKTLIALYWLSARLNI